MRYQKICSMGVRRPQYSYRVDTQPDDRRGVWYSFYKPNGYTQSKLVTEKLKGAEKIIVWDPSFNEKDKGFYNYITSSKITLEILTICDKNQTEKQVSDYFALIRDLLVDKNIDIDFTLRAFFFNEFKNRDSLELWHDRYLIIQRNETIDVYLVGTSVASHVDGHKAFGICELKEDKDKDIVITAYNEYCKLIDKKNGITLHDKDPKD